jgi:small subunit ribosomal protein S6
VKRDYELGFILSPEASEEEARAIMDRVEQVVTTHDGQIVKVNQWGRRRLAYPIERHRDGIYVFIDMTLTPESVSELERTLKVSEIVLRHMVKRRDPKAVQKEREEREAREARAAAPVTTTTEAEEPAPANEEVEETPVLSEVEETPVLSEEDLQDVPPAIEEEALEA